MKIIDEELLKEMNSLHSELKDLRKRYDKTAKKETQTVKDSVRGSSTTYPYTQHTCVVEGVEYPKSKRTRYIYRKQIKEKQKRLDKLIVKLEYDLNYIEDKYSEIRQIIRYKYEDGKTWLQIMFLMNYNSESVAKMKLKRFFEKVLECDKCDDII